jgi:hypothetical protein
MGQSDRTLTLLIVDPDDGFQAELRSANIAGMHPVFLDRHSVCPVRVQMEHADVLVIGVECPGGLSLLADLCGRPSMPPVIAVSGLGFEGKSIEHVLLLAEIRGAALALPKPLEARDLFIAAQSVAAMHSAAGRQDQGKVATPRAQHRR